MKIEEVIPEYGHADFYTKTERDKKHRETNYFIQETKTKMRPGQARKGTNIMKQGTKDWNILEDNLRSTRNR